MSVIIFFLYLKSRYLCFEVCKLTPGLKIIKSTNNFEFDYSSNVNGIPSIEDGDYLVAPVFKVEPVNSYKQVENPYNIAKYSLGNYGYHLLMLTPIILSIKLINKNKYQK